MDLNTKVTPRFWVSCPLPFGPAQHQVASLGHAPLIVCLPLAAAPHSLDRDTQHNLDGVEGHAAVQGVLLQIFTQPLSDRPTVFLEIIQRIGCTSVVQNQDGSPVMTPKGVPQTIQAGGPPHCTKTDQREQGPCWMWQGDSRSQQGAAAL